MSINVHVTGNPISIKRGKMVTTDLDHTKKEFDKRRLMRLEQVRQQSKEIAEDVRNKVRREKSKQMKQIEKEGEAKLRNWQNRKLLELQTQYEEALNEFGLAHREADTLNNESEVTAQEREAHDAISQERGKVAMNKAYQRKTDEQLKRASTIERRKIVRDIEDTRSAMVSNFPKNKSQEDESHVRKKKHRASADVNITIPDSANSSQSQSSSCDCTDASEFQSMCVSKRSDVSRGPSPDFRRNPAKSHQYDVPPQPEKVSSPSRRQSFKKHPPSSPSKRNSPNRHQPSSFEEVQHSQVHKSCSKSPPRDTRISERIKRRGLIASQTDYCDEQPEIQPIPYIESNTKIRDAIDARMYKKSDSRGFESASFCDCGHRRNEVGERLNMSPHPDCICRKKDQPQQDTHATQTNQTDLVRNSQKFDEIPSKPSVKLKSFGVDDNSMKQSQKSSIVDEKLARHFQRNEEKPDKPHTRIKSSSKIDNLSSQDTKLSTETSKVQFYDHPNRFQYEKDLPRTSYVEKIPTESLEVIPNEVSEAEWSEQIKKREKEAQLRGRQALDRERIRKHYEEIMKKLPLLQKKERIGEIFNDKPEYHMSEERLKEKERIRQNHLENAFNKRFPNMEPTPVTLPKVPPAKEDRRLLESGSVQSINVAEWDVDFKEPKMFTVQEVQEIVKAFTDQRPEDRQAKLKELLKHLKLQREQLIEEIRALPQDDSIDELVRDLRSFADDDERAKTKSRRRDRDKSAKKRYREEKDTSAESSVDGSSSNVADKDRKIGAVKSPRKKAKMKSRRRVLVLQNTSTQTTPKQQKNSSESTSTDSVEPRTESTKPPPKICDLLHVPCDCNKENGKEPSEEVCQIMIKLRDDEDPSVVVKSKEAKSVGVGTEMSPAGTKEGPRVVKPKSRKEKEPSNQQTMESSRSTSKTWKDQLSKNSISTTSTSYFSPPDLQSTKDSQKSSLFHLRKKPQQAELSSAYNESSYLGQTSCKERADPRIVKYIEKLLGMARGSIENLSVSTSTVQTPSQSVIEIDSNNPGVSESVYDMLKAFPFKISDIAEELSYSPELSPAPPNTSVALSVSDQGSSGANSRVLSHEKDQSKDAMVAQYADITDSCSKRIEALAAMIQQLRQEKIQMLQVPATESRSKPDSPVLSDKEISTKYLDLPDARESSKSSSNSSLDEEEIFKRLMEIDFSLAKKLKQFKAEERNKEADQEERSTSKNDPPSMADTNEELFARLRRLKKPVEPPKTVPSAPAQNHAFVPFLSDIPKLPKFEASPDTGQNHKRPPPSKGLSVARKFNENILVAPHELSTIVEADSQLSTNVSKASLNFSALKDIDLLLIPEEKVAEASAKIEDISKPKLVSSSLDESSMSPSKSSSREQSSSSSNTMKLPEGVGLKRLAKNSSSSSDDIENIESMLKSIGMEWAIPTMHKTQEALALTSSSSSDLSARRKRTVSSESEVSLRELLRQQLLSKISSSTMKTDNSLGSLLGEFSDLSAIHGGNTSVDKDRQRTSTPVTASNKSTSKSKLVFSGDSDLSSVRHEPSGSKRS